MVKVPKRSRLEKLRQILSRAGTQSGRVPLRHTPIYIAIIAYINYFSLYFLRKSQTTTKTLYLDEFFGQNSTNKQVYGGWLDNAYLIPYAVGQVLYPNAVDYLGSRTGWLCCLLPASVSLVLVKFVQEWWQLTLCLIGTAMSQSLCWPAAVKMLSKFMSNEQYKLILPIWGSCVFVGNFMGNLLSAYILDSGTCQVSCLQDYENTRSNQNNQPQNQNTTEIILDWTALPGLSLSGSNDETITVRELKNALDEQRYSSISENVFFCRSNNWRDVFWMPACVPVAVSIITFLLSPNDSPSNSDNLVTINSLDEAREKIIDKNENLEQKDFLVEANETELEKKEIPSMLTIARRAGVGWCLAIGYFCVKGARYWMYYWAVPLMTEITEKRWDEAEGARQLSYADTGGLISSFILPLFLMTYTCCGRKFFLRTMFICVIVCGMATPTLISLVYKAIPSMNKSATSGLWFIYGFLLGIPDNLYSGVAVNDLATYMGGDIQASLAGFVNGLGGFGPFIGSPLTGRINEATDNQTGSWVAIGFLIIGTVASVIADILLTRKKNQWLADQMQGKVNSLAGSKTETPGLVDVEEAGVVLLMKSEPIQDHAKKSNEN